MKHLAKKFLQTILGFDNYLFLFSLYVIRTLRWNSNERDFLYFLKMLPDEGTIMDIGANIGIMTVHFAQRLPNTRIVAFEPIPSNIKALRRIVNYYDLQNVEIKDFALGNYDGEAEMVMPVLDSLPMQGLSHVMHESIPDLNEGRKYRIKIRKADNLEFFKDEEFRLKAIKIDVENFEYFVLAGAEQLIRQHHPLVYAELWQNENRNKCFSLLQSIGYKVMVLFHGKLVAYLEGTHSTQNFFFIPQSFPVI
jgi:FkbM family methyltransferase